ncbi:MAG: prepilin-type N-terminal cleavage/methylation domain-containing protein [Candidatus Paceibacterota bacterium]
MDLKQKANIAKTGFTLIELMTVMAIIFIMSILAVSNYHQGGSQVVLDVEANRFAQDLRRVQEWSMAAHQVAGVAKKGYGIYVSAVSGSYIVYTDNNGNGIYDAPSELYETVVLDKKVEISSCTPNPASVDFMVTSPVTKINGGDATTVQKVQIWLKNNHNMKRTVTVNKAGLIYVE